MSERTMLTTRQVAERLEVTLRTVQRWVDIGRFPGAYRLDPDANRSPYLIPVADVEAFEERRQAGQPQTQENAQ